MDKITESGPQNWRTLLKQNQGKFTSPTDRMQYSDMKKILRGEYLPDYSYEEKQTYLNQLGVGESKFDKNLILSYDLAQMTPEDVNENRYQQQSGLAQLGQGVLKMAGTATTTIADNTLGFVVGLGNVIAQSVNGNVDDAGDVLNAFINNPLTIALDKANQKLKEALPTYTSAQYKANQESGQWWKNLGSTAFWADFIDNTGFMVGMAVSGALSGAAIAKSLGTTELRNVLKQTLKCADDKALMKALDEVAQGTRTLTPELKELVEANAKKLQKDMAVNRLITSFAASNGEARLEAVDAANSYGKDAEMAINKDYQDKLDNLPDLIRQQHPELFSYERVPVGDGTFTMIKVLSDTDNYNRIYNSYKAQYDNTKNQALSRLADEKKSLGNAVFGLNQATLFLSDFIAFGHTLGRGFKYENNNARLTKQISDRKLKKELGEDAFNEYKKSELNKLSRELKVNKGYINFETAKKAFSPVREFNEEMLQQAYQTGYEGRAAKDLNEFYGYTLMQEGEDFALSNMNALTYGIKQSYGDFSNYQAGFQGLLGAIVPLPGIGLKVSRTSGTKGDNGEITGRKLQWEVQNELWNSFGERKQMINRANELVDRYNQFINDKKYMTLFNNLSRGEVLKSIKTNSVLYDDKFEALSAANKEFISMCNFYDSLGRLDELKEVLGTYANLNKLSEEQQNTLITDLKNALAHEDGSTPYDGMSNEEIVTKLSQNATENLNSLKEYTQISQDIKGLFGTQTLNEASDFADDFLAEMTFITAHQKDLEKRALDIFNNIKDFYKTKIFHVRPAQDLVGDPLLYVESTEDLELSEAFRQAELDKSKEKMIEEKLSRRERYRNLVEGVNTINELVNFFNNKEARTLLIEDANIAGKDASIEDKKMFHEITDLVKLMQARSDYAYKFMQLSNNPSLFTKANQEALQKKLEESENNFIQSNVDLFNNITNLTDFRNTLNNIDSNVRDKVLKKLRLSENDTVSKLTEDYLDLEKFRESVNGVLQDTQFEDSNNATFTANILNMILGESTSMEEIANKLRGVRDSEGIPPEVISIVESLLQTINTYNSNKTKSKADSNKTRNPKGKKVFNAFDDTDEEESPIVEEKEDEPLEDEIQIKDEEVKEDIDFNNPTEVYDYLDNLSSAELEEITRNKSLNGSTELYKRYKGMIDAFQSNQDSNANEVPVIDENKNDGNDIIPEKIESTTTGNKPDLVSWTVTQYDINEAKRNHNRVNYEVTTTQAKNLQNLLITSGAYEFVDSGKLIDSIKKDNTIYYINHRDLGILLAVKTDKNNPNALEINNEYYQLVGSLGFNNSEEFQRVADLRNEEIQNNNNQYVVLSRVGSVKQIYTGRLITSINGSDKEMKPLSEVEGVWNTNNPTGEVPIISVNVNGEFRGINSNLEVVPLNTNNPNDLNGSVWVLTKEADGRYYPKALTVQLTNEVDFTNNNEIINSIKRDLKIFVDSTKSREDRLSAKVRLRKAIYFPGENQLLFGNFSGEDIITFNGESITNNAYPSIEDKVNKLIELIQNAALRFQIDHTRLTSIDYVKSLISSNILITDLAMLHNVNGSFDLNTFKDEVASNERPKVGHTGDKQIQEKPTIIQFGKEHYHRRESDGKFVDSNDNVVSEKINAILTLKEGGGTRYSNSDLFIITDNLGNEYGLIGNRVLEGEALQKKKDSIDKKNNSNKQSVAIEQEANRIDEGNVMQDSFGEDIVVDNFPTRRLYEDNTSGQSQEESSTEEIPVEEPSIEETPKVKETIIPKSNPDGIANDEFESSTTTNNNNVVETLRKLDIKLVGKLLNILGLRYSSLTPEKIADLKNNKNISLSLIEDNESLQELIDTIENCRS